MDQYRTHTKPFSQLLSLTVHIIPGDSIGVTNQTTTDSAGGVGQLQDIDGGSGSCPTHYFPVGLTCPLLEPWPPTYVT